MRAVRKQLVFEVTVVVLMSIAVFAGVPPLSRYEAMMKQESPVKLGLYNDTDKVKILTTTNFNDEVINSSHSNLVEFYNSFCGHCKRFAPTYKDLAEQLYSWRDIMPVCAVDCADDLNYVLCREYEVMSYPTLRYFGPNFTPQTGNYGKVIDLYDFENIKAILAEFIANEKPPTDSNSIWPNLTSLAEDNLLVLLNKLPMNVKYGILMYEPENSTLGIEIALHLTRFPDVMVRRTSNVGLALKYDMDVNIHKFATINRQGHITAYTTSGNTTNAVLDTILSFLEAEHITEKPFKQEFIYTIPENKLEELKNSELVDIINEVKRNKHMVYQADLEMAIHTTLLNEIPKHFNISGYKFKALQRFITVLEKYNPLGPNGRLFITNLLEFVEQHTDEISGKVFEEEVKRLQQQHTPVFLAKRYVGCASAQPNLRGFTCSLWQLCHYMTVQASKTPTNSNALDVLQAMYDYIKYFFGCTDCSDHFQDMAKSGQMWNVTNHDEAILWLWRAHNVVNARLAGDITEDPQFPKVQFPTPGSCPKCHINGKPTTINSSPALELVDWPLLSLGPMDEWNLQHVLQFLKNIYNAKFISHYDLKTDEEQYAHSGFGVLQQARRKRTITNVFTDIDIRMGMLLYGCCIVMIVGAFKLFALRGGYRRKPYGSHAFTKA